MRSEKPSDLFQTPPKLFKELSTVFNFFWDACCNKYNCLGPNMRWFVDTYWNQYDYLTEDMNSRYSEYKTECNNNDWTVSDTIFMNPPYSNPQPFIEKAWEDAKNFRVVMLLKTDTSTDWFNHAFKDCRNLSTMRLQLKLSVKTVMEHLVKTMEMDRLPIGILHLRKRVKFYVSEEIFDENTNKKGFKDKWLYQMDDNQPEDILMETKNYKRVEDGIVSKSSANFPSMIMIFDRRGPK